MRDACASFRQVSWAVSAIMHYSRLGLNGGVSQLLGLWHAREHCFLRANEPRVCDHIRGTDDHKRRTKPFLRCLGTEKSRRNQKSRSWDSCYTEYHGAGQHAYPLRSWVVGILDGAFNDSGVAPSLPLWLDAVDEVSLARSLHRSKAHLEASVYGLVEYMEPSLCLILFELGRWGGSTLKRRCESRRNSSSGLLPWKNRADEVLQGNDSLSEPNRQLLLLKLVEHKELYAFGKALFFARATHVHTTTGTQLLGGWE